MVDEVMKPRKECGLGQSGNRGDYGYGVGLYTVHGTDIRGNAIYLAVTPTQGALTAISN
jgi:hypothetical protein